ncbi:MAG: oligosaccharide flippase family protein [Glaciihabitans sp.]
MAAPEAGRTTEQRTDPNQPAVPPPTTALACVSLAHTDPVQLRRLIDALDPFPVFLHCDPKTAPEVFAEMTADLPERVTILDRVETGWAKWGNVEAELVGYRAALDQSNATHIAVMTGTDYPLASTAEIAEILAEFPDKSIASVNPLPHGDWGRDGGFARLRYRHWAVGKRMLRLPIPRRLPRDVVPAGGPQMKILARKHAEIVLHAAETRPDLVDFWRRSWVADETFVPTILNSPGFAPHWENEHESASAWWVWWGERPSKSPTWLGLDFRDEILSGRKYGQDFPRLFARKFSTAQSTELLDAIDAHRSRPRAPRGPAATQPGASTAEDSGEPAQGAHPTDGAPAVSVPVETMPAAANESSHLFGRGLLYVVVWALQLIAGTVVSPILAYTLGPAEFGALASAIALHQVLSVLALLGLDQAIMLERSDEPSGRTARGLLSVGIAISFAVTLTLTLTGGLWAEALGFDGFSPLVVAVILWTAPGAVVQAILALLLAEDRLRSFTWVSALAAVGGQLFGLFLLFFVHRDATTYAWGGVASQFLAMGIGIVLARPRLRGLFDVAIAWRAIKLGIPLAVVSLGYFVLNAGDRIVIQRILGPAEVGRYQVAYVVGYTVVLLLTFTSSAWLPRFAAVKDDAERWRLSAQSRDELYRLLIPVVFAVTLAAPIALRIVAPSTFEPNGLVLVVFLVALSAYPVAAGGASSRLLITLRKGRTVATITLIAAAVNIGVNILLVPLIGISGAATGTVIAFGLMALMQRFALPKDPAWVRTPRPLLAGIAVSVVLAAASILLPQTLPWNIGKLVVAVSCLPWFFVVLRRARRGPAPVAAPAAPASAPDTSAPDTPAPAPSAATSSTTPRSTQ